MRKNDLERTIRNAFMKLPAPLLSDDVKEACRSSTQAETVKKRVRPLVWVPSLIAVAAAVVLIVSAVFNGFAPSLQSTWTVSLDVNPSIAVEVDEKESIVSVIALNDEARAVIGDTDYSGQGVATTVNALVASMVENGYLSEIANSVLISVDSADVEKAASMQTKLSAEVEALLAKSGFSGAVMSQTIGSDKELAELAKQYGISTGKAVLIEHIRLLDPLKTFDELASASINELNLLAERLQVDIQSTGEASAKAYIGADEAWRIAAEDAGIAAERLTIKDAELDFERGRMCYELEFVFEGVEYDYDLDAVTGEILKVKQETEHEEDRHPGEYKHLAASAYADAAQVKADVLAHAGLTEADIHDYDAEWDVKKGVPVFEVDFGYNGQEYEYIVHMETGEILSCETEVDDEYEDRPQNTEGWLSEEAVKQAVFADAVVAQSEVRGYECEADTEDGLTVYEIEFEVGGTEYEYRVDAKTGEILNVTQDTD